MDFKILVVLFLFMGACRSSVPPLIEICILDSFGSADCLLADGTKVVKLPSELTNYWATNQPDQARFAAWCYDTSQQVIDKRLEDLLIEIKSK